MTFLSLWRYINEFLSEKKSSTDCSALSVKSELDVSMLHRIFTRLLTGKCSQLSYSCRLFDTKVFNVLHHSRQSFCKTR